MRQTRLDDNYQTYVNRVLRMTLPETYKSKLQHIQESPKFQPQASDQQWQAVPFPGYTVITPPWLDDSENTALYTTLKAYQQQLLEQLAPGLLVPVPPESFHMTLADLIWDSAYHHASQNPEFEAQLCTRINQIFQQYEQSAKGKQPIRWQAIGLLIMTRAIGICLAPQEESAYEPVVQLRRAIYQNPDLIALGIEQQYNLTAHVTLGYFGAVPFSLDQESEAEQFADGLSHTLAQLNQQWLDGEPQSLWVHRVELRKFDDMTHYYRQSDWPVLQF